MSVMVNLVSSFLFDFFLSLPPTGVWPPFWPNSQGVSPGLPSHVPACCARFLSLSISFEEQSQCYTKGTVNEEYINSSSSPLPTCIPCVIRSVSSVAYPFILSLSNNFRLLSSYIQHSETTIPQTKTTILHSNRRLSVELQIQHKKPR